MTHDCFYPNSVAVPASPEPLSAWEIHHDYQARFPDYGVTLSECRLFARSVGVFVYWYGPDQLPALRQARDKALAEDFNLFGDQPERRADARSDHVRQLIHQALS